MRKRVLCAALLASVPFLCYAVATRTWLTSSYAEFDKGELKGVSLRSDGRITLAPAAKELFDSSLAYLWALARDSNGVLYAGGGPGARVYRYSKGKFEKIAEFDAVEVHALAIDKANRVYAATFPDGRIYRLVDGGKPEEFYNPKRKYIWSMLFDASGNLLLATGDKGEIHRVTPAGQGEVFFQTDDTHVRALASSGSDLIVGTDPTGLVIRITPERKGFVLYQLPKREVTAVAVGKDGAIYAAGAGTQQSAGGTSSLLSALSSPSASAANPSASAAPSAPPAAPGATERPASAAPDLAASPRTAALSGGSEVYRIDASGMPEKIWSHPRDVVYSIGFDRNGAPILGAGNKGTLYRIDTPSLYTALESVNVNQITALLVGSNGSLVAATANVGKVFEFGPQLEAKGIVTSEVFDSGSFSLWGKLTPYGDFTGGQLSLESHSGNLDRPRNYWSSWGEGPPPPARFVQWRAVLKNAGGGSPVLDSVEQAYLARNVAPRIDEIEATPPNYKFPAPVVPTLLQRTPGTLTLPAIGKKPSASTASTDTESSVMTYAKGWLGLRWTAVDENSDPLLYSLEIRGVHEMEWKPLKQKLTERHYSFDSTAYPDGEYRIRIIATDQPGNPGGNALTSQADSSPILVDNTPPAVTGLHAQANGSGLQVTWKAADALSVIKRAEYALDGGDWEIADPVSKLSDAQTLEYSVLIPDVKAGEHTIAVRVVDDYENVAVAKTVWK